MKRKNLTILLCLICLFGLTACNKTVGESIFSSDYVNLEIIEDTSDGKILVDKDTGVLYLLYINNVDGIRSQTLTPLYNTDGSLKNISDFE